MLTSEVRTTTLHLFRALLRATSYLPDKFARQYLHNYIKNRFRNTREATPSRLKTAQRYVKVLQRAGDGDIDDLKSVLLHAYGRTGKRRVQLLTRFLRSTGPSTANTQETLWEEMLRVRHDAQINSIHPAFAALLESQYQRRGLDSIRGPIKQIEPRIPKENAWGRPMPIKRERNMKRRFWLKTLDSVMPPISKYEWNRLRDLALGVIPFENPPPKRSRIPKPTSLTLDIAHITQPIQHTDREKKAKSYRSSNIHKLSARFMRRLYAVVWSQCPNLVYHDGKSEWIVTWGNSKSAASSGLFSKIGEQQLELLEGMEDLAPSPNSSPNSTSEGRFGKIRYP